MWDQIVSVLDHCLSFYFPRTIALGQSTGPVRAKHVQTRGKSLGMHY